MWTRLVFVTTLAFLAAAGGAGAQSAFSVDPLLVSLGNGSNSAVMTLTNTSAREIRFELKAFAWDQGADGVTALADTKDVVVFPPLVTLKPKAIQRVRIGTTAPASPTERAYRLMIEELPSGAAPPTANTVAVRTRVGVPVFIEPAKVARTGTIGDIQIAKRKVTVPLQNTGNVHAMVDVVSVKGMASEDQIVWEREAQGWYVLAGKTRMWTYDLRGSECNVKYVEVEVYAHDRVLTKRANVPAGACNP